MDFGKTSGARLELRWFLKSRKRFPLVVPSVLPAARGTGTPRPQPAPRPRAKTQPLDSPPDAAFQSSRELCPRRPPPHRTPVLGSAQTGAPRALRFAPLRCLRAHRSLPSLGAAGFSHLLRPRLRNSGKKKKKREICNKFPCFISTPRHPALPLLPGSGDGRGWLWDGYALHVTAQETAGGRDGDRGTTAGRAGWGRAWCRDMHGVGTSTA